MVGDGMPGGMDAHVPNEATRSRVQTDLMRAASRAKSSMRGSVPAEVEDVLGELSRPVLRFTDIMMNDCQRRCREDGARNDWKHFRRRWLAASPRQYLPHRHGLDLEWLAMVDTSGSMGDEDLSFGISQLQALAGRGTRGTVVLCDATVKWDAVQPIRDLKDLKRVKIVGRGGTVFDDFFREFPKRLGLNFGCVAVITDGDCGTVPARLRPPLPVNWILTRNKEGWSQPFGRALNLRNDRP